MITIFINYIIIPFLILFNQEHDAPVAIFKLTNQTESTEVHIFLDINDLHHNTSIHKDSINLNFLSDYINNNFIISYDGLAQQAIFDSVVIKQDHYHIYGIIKSNYSTTQLLHLSNTCLLATEGQTNIIQLRYDNQLRDFRMGKDRQELKIDL